MPGGVNRALILGIHVLFIALIPLVSATAFAGQSPFAFEANFTDSVAIDAEIGGNGVVYILYSDYSLKAVNLSQSDKAVLWEARPDKSLVNGEVKRGLALITNSTSGEKILVWTILESGSGGVYNITVRFLDPKTGSDVLPQFKTTTRHPVTALIAPKYFTGNKIPLAILSSDDQVIEYYANGTARIHSLGILFVTVYPVHASFSPNGSFFAVQNSLGSGVIVFKLEGDNWQNNNITIPTDSRLRLVKWLDDTNLLLFGTSYATINGSGYEVAKIVDFSSFPNYTVRSVLINDSASVTYSISSYVDTYLDDNGNLIIPLWDSSFRESAGLPGSNAGLWVFSLGQVFWVNHTTGYLNSYPTVIRNLEFGAQLVRVGPGFVYYRDYPDQLFESLVEYRIDPKTRGAKIAFNSEHTYLARTSPALAITAADDGSAYIALNAGVGDGDLFIYKMDTRTGRLSELDWVPTNKTLEFATFKWLALHVTGMDVSPNGRILAVAGGIEDTESHSGTVSGGEKAVVRVYDAKSGSLLFSDVILFPQSDNNRRNIYVPTVQFLSDDLLLVALEYFDYIKNPGTLRHTVLVYNITDRRIVHNWTITQSFIPGNLDGQSLQAVGSHDRSTGEISIYVVSSTQAVAGTTTQHSIIAYSLKIPSTGSALVTNKTIITRTGTGYTGIRVVGTGLSPDKTSLYAGIIVESSIKSSLILKLDARNLNKLRELNITGWLPDVNTRSGVDGVISGLRTVNDTVLAYIETYFYGDPPVNLIALDSNLNPLWNISFTEHRTLGGVSIITNYGLPYNGREPTNHHFDASVTGNHLFILSSKGLHKLSKPSAQQPPTTPSQPPGNLTSTPPTPTQLTPQKLEYAKKFLTVRENVMKVQENIKSILLNATRGLDISQMSLSGVRELLKDAKIREAMDQLVEEGLVKKVSVRLSVHYREELRAVLEHLYGPLLEDYPTPAGRIYLLYVIYFSGDDG